MTENTVSKPSFEYAYLAVWTEKLGVVVEVKVATQQFVGGGKTMLIPDEGVYWNVTNACKDLAENGAWSNGAFYPAHVIYSIEPLTKYGNRLPSSPPWMRQPGIALTASDFVS